MRIISIVAAAVMLASSASAQSRPTLWEKVEAGMSIAEVHAAYPQGGKIKWHGTKQTEIEDVVILEGCEAEVEIQHEGGAVDVVKVKGKGSLGGRCADKVLTALSAKYGQPAVQRERSGSILARQGEVSVWSKDDVAMRFKQYTGNAFGGGGLGAASWELAYTASASEIAL